MTSISKRRNQRVGVFRRTAKPGLDKDGRPVPPSVSGGAAAVDDEAGTDHFEGDDKEYVSPLGSNEAKTLFEGDASTLPYDVRRAFALLLRGPSLDERHSRLWPVLLAHEIRLRELLHNVFLDLVIDREQRVAFTRPVHAPELDVPHLLREVRLTFLDTALVLFLRMRLTLAEAAGERATLARSEMIDQLKAYEASDNVDRSRFGKQVDNAIEKAKKYNFLRQIRNSGDRFEVSPALKLVFSHEQIRALQGTYRRIAAELAGEPATGEAAAAGNSDAPSDDEDVETQDEVGSGVDADRV
ncbi:MAG: DUF4194 domain-containing protein [Rubrivivax sp.]